MLRYIYLHNDYLHFIYKFHFTYFDFCVLVSTNMQERNERISLLFATSSAVLKYAKLQNTGKKTVPSLVTVPKREEKQVKMAMQCIPNNYPWTKDFGSLVDVIAKYQIKISNVSDQLIKTRVFPLNQKIIVFSLAQKKKKISE